MTEIMQAAAQLGWPGAVAIVAVCACAAGCVWALAWLWRG